MKGLAPHPNKEKSFINAPMYAYATPAAQGKIKHKYENVCTQREQLVRARPTFVKVDK